MSFLFEPYDNARCCLCGAREDLTGEHKIAASALRSIFGHEKMAIGVLDNGDPLRMAQGPKSKAFHFKAKICRTCNSSRTQKPDNEFQHFNTMVQELLDQDRDPTEVFASQRYQQGTPEYLNVFRYLAKLLCCHLAESEGPRPKPVAAFAIGRLHYNNMLLQIDRDPIYDDYKKLAGEHSYASHGGLVVYSNAETGLPEQFQTSLTLGPARYRFWIRFDWPAALDLKIFHGDFLARCQAAHQQALKSPMTDDERHRRGV